jgi:hypothetical protein
MLTLMWEKQPTTSRIEDYAKQLNLDMISGRWTDASVDVDLIRAGLRDK